MTSSHTAYAITINHLIITSISIIIIIISSSSSNSSGGPRALLLASALFLASGSPSGHRKGQGDITNIATPLADSEAGSASYDGDLRVEPQRGRAPGEGVKRRIPPEAESVLAIKCRISA